MRRTIRETHPSAISQNAISAAGHTLAEGIRAGEAAVTRSLHFHVGGQVVTTPIPYMVGERGVWFRGEWFVLPAEQPLWRTLDELVVAARQLQVACHELALAIKGAA